MGVVAEGEFARFYDFFFDRILRPIRKKNIEIAKAYKKNRIIDLGCGTGSQCLMLLKQGLSVTGLDNSDKMLTVARKKIQRDGVFYLGDITSNNFSDSQFDCVFITLVLHPNDQATIKKIIKEAKRIIDDDGIIVITDYDKKSHFKGKVVGLFIRIIESCANQSHRTNYFSFMNQGGIVTILKKQRYQIKESYTFYHGGLKTCVIS